MTDDKDDPRRVDGGHFYGRRTPRSPLEPMADGDVDRPPDAWICRRIVDYPNGQQPAGAALDTCARCSALIAYNPARVPTVPANTPKICMQCAHIQPLPMP